MIDWLTSRDAILDGQTGWLVPPRNVEAFIARTRQLLDDPALRQRMGRAAQERVRREFSLAAAVRAQLDAYAATLRAKGLPVPWAPP